jgi:GNAT superfamily N-acetyltransferase
MANMSANPELLAGWLKGWALAHDAPLPTACGAGWHVNVGLPNQKARYVFAEPDPDFWRLAETISEPLIYLKVCAPHDRIKHLFPERWTTEHRGFIMTHDDIPPQMRQLPDVYSRVINERPYGLTCKIYAEDGAEAASGNLVLADGVAVYDHIHTEESHRRKGLASVVMATLQNAAHEMGRRRDVLCASHAGLRLYETLGWQIHSFYTSAMIEA